MDLGEAQSRLRGSYRKRYQALTPSQVAWVRINYWGGKKSVIEMMAQYDVSDTTLYSVINRTGVYADD